MYNVLHILDESIPKSSGYAVRAKYIARFQKENGLNPVCITSPKYKRGGGYEIIDDVSYYRSIIKDNLFFKIPFLREFYIMQKFQRDINELVETENIDIIHAHSPSLCGLPAMKVAKEKNIPFVYEIRAFWEDAAVDLQRFKENSLKYKISQYMENKLFKNADAVVAICEGIKKEIGQRLQGKGQRTSFGNTQDKKGKVYVVENGVDTEQFKPIEKANEVIEKYNLENKTVVSFIGSFFKFEGLELLLKSVPEIIKRNKDVVFLIVGSGVENDNLRNLAKSNPIIDENVIFTGRVPHEQILDYYSFGDIFVYPRVSKRITEFVTPLKPLEAMAMEKAVIISDVGGLKELIEEENTAVIFKNGDSNDLAEKIITLINNKEKREAMGKFARDYVIKSRQWKDMVANYKEIYEGILEKRVQGKGLE